jgi:hypothetical protein
VTPLIEGFGHFVTSMPAPTASGWSDVAGRVSHPLESAALSRRTPFVAIRTTLNDPSAAILFEHSAGAQFENHTSRENGLFGRVFIQFAPLTSIVAVRVNLFGCVLCVGERADAAPGHVTLNICCRRIVGQWLLMKASIVAFMLCASAAHLS